MDAEQVLKLFDSYWFHNEIFTKIPRPLSSSTTDPVDNQTHEFDQALQPKVFRLPSLLYRSLSDQLSIETSFKSGSLSPDTVLPTPKLETIFSDKEVGDVKELLREKVHVERPTKRVTSRRTIKGSSKILSDLEFEELKGFMDLGFVFTEEDKDSSLVSIIPGLQRLGKKVGEDESLVDETSISRPYLSEAWAHLDRKEEETPLLNWTIPPLCNEIDMKYHLRCWAHTVASTVR